MRRTFACMCVVGLLVLSTCAWGFSGSPLTVKATSGGKVAQWSYNFVPDVSSYQLAAPIQLRASDNTLLGTIQGMNWGVQGDPVLTLNFAVQAVGNTNFTFDTGDLLFSTIDVPVGFATAATTLTADAGGAALTGNFAGGKAYRATYNLGTVFADLDSSYVSAANTSATETDRHPGADFTAIGVPVSSMRAQWDFNLSAGDGASGTSRFDIEPSPIPDASTLALAVAGVAPMLVGFVARRRKQS